MDRWIVRFCWRVEREANGASEMSYQVMAVNATKAIMQARVEIMALYNLTQEPERVSAFKL